jgi:hypothetical protein
MWVRTPAQGDIAFVPNQEQKQILDAVQKFRRIIFKKDRQIGLSTAVENFILCEARARVMNIGIFVPTFSTTLNVIRRLKVNAMPSFSIVTTRGITLDNGSNIEIDSFETTKLCSKSFDLVFLDEFSFMKDNPIVDVLPHTKRLIAASDLDWADQSVKILDSV